VAGSRNNTGEATLRRAGIRGILIAPDSFKGSLSAAEAARAIEAGLRDALPGVPLRKHPVSDGGEGLVSVLTPALRGTIQETEVSGPLPGQRVRARWGFSAGTKTAIIEMAEAAGLTLVPEVLRDPLVTTSYGVGELLRAALDTGAARVILGLGGSATNDGGSGMAEALGVRFLNASGATIGRGGGALKDLVSVDTGGIDGRLKDLDIIVACDVRNVLVGPEGASAVFGPQKGASPRGVAQLDRGLEIYAGVLTRGVGIDVRNVPGSGAAGGLGAGLLAFCHAELKRGIDVVLDATGFDAELEAADLVITGEGKIDRQSRFGKALSGILERATKTGKPVLAVVGQMEGSPGEFCGPEGFVDIETLVNRHTPVETAMANASRLIHLRVVELLQRFISQA
jgi:glycerate 2-kinase